MTGTSRGIGLTIAEGLACYGADVAMVARSQDRLSAAGQEISRSTGRRIWTFPANLSDLDTIPALFEEIVRQTGGIDILVNAAGTTIRCPTEDLQRTAFDSVLALNLTAPLLLCQAFCRHCKDSDRAGKIINIASLLCHATRPSIAAYTVSKMGLVGLTKTLAVEWARYRITVNAIAPGYIRTELTAGLQSDPEFDRWVISKTPLGRWGLPTDVVGLAILLASKAGAFITGQVFFVDGGWSSML